VAVALREAWTSRWIWPEQRDHPVIWPGGRGGLSIVSFFTFVFDSHFISRVVQAFPIAGAGTVQGGWLLQCDFKRCSLLMLRVVISVSRNRF
jgi:hypothetical protein